MKAQHWIGLTVIMIIIAFAIFGVWWYNSDTN